MSLDQDTSIRAAYISRNEQSSAFRLAKDEERTPGFRNESYTQKGLPPGQLGARILSAMHAGARILVVDDDRRESGWNVLLTEALQRLGHTVTSAYDAGTSVKTLQTQSFNGITIDGLGGRWKDVLEAAQVAGVQNVALISASEICLQEMTQELGADCVLSKFDQNLREGLKRLFPPDSPTTQQS